MVPQVKGEFDHTLLILIASLKRFPTAPCGKITKYQTRKRCPDTADRHGARYHRRAKPTRAFKYRFLIPFAACEVNQIQLVLALYHSTVKLFKVQRKYSV